MNKLLLKISVCISSLIGIFMLISFLFPVVVKAQNLLNLPESIVYDFQNKRYLVSNWGSGNVVQIDSNGIQSIFLNNSQCYAGLHILGNVLYAACREYGVKGFDLTTGANVLSVNIPGATNINDITADTSGNLYVSYPTGSKIYRVNINSQTYSTFVDIGLDTPNGLYFDERYNRLLIISYKYYSSVQAVDLADSSLTTVVTTNLHNLDGLARDNEGNYYVSSWYNNSIYRFDSSFASPPELYSTHTDDPADIYINIHKSILAVPLFFTHTVKFITVPTSIGNGKITNTPAEFKLFQNYPNPFNPTTTISYDLPKSMVVELTIYNVLGEKVRTLICEKQTAGRKSVVWNGIDDNGKEVSSGEYFCLLKAGENIKSIRIVLLK